MAEFAEMRNLLAQMNKRLLKAENVNSMLYTEERLYMKSQTKAAESHLKTD